MATVHFFFDFIHVKYAQNSRAHLWMKRFASSTFDFILTFVELSLSNKTMWIQKVHFVCRHSFANSSFANFSHVSIVKVGWPQDAVFFCWLFSRTNLSILRITFFSVLFFVRNSALKTQIDIYPLFTWCFSKSAYFHSFATPRMYACVTFLSTAISCQLKKWETKLSDPISFHFQKTSIAKNLLFERQKTSWNEWKRRNESFHLHVISWNE